MSQEIEKIIKPAVKTYIVWYNIWNLISITILGVLIAVLFYFFKFLPLKLNF